MSRVSDHLQSERYRRVDARQNMLGALELLKRARRLLRAAGARTQAEHVAKSIESLDCRLRYKTKTPKIPEPELFPNL